MGLTPRYQSPISDIIAIFWYALHPLLLKEEARELSTTLGISVAPLNQNGPHLDMGWLR